MVASQVRVVRRCPEAALPLLVPATLLFNFGGRSLLWGAPAAFVMWLLWAVPWRIAIDGTAVRVEYLPFGLARRTLNGRTLYGETGPKTIMIESPRPVFLHHTEIHLFRPGDVALVAALRSAGVTFGGAPN